MRSISSRIIHSIHIYENLQKAVAMLIIDTDFGIKPSSLGT